MMINSKSWLALALVFMIASCGKKDDQDKNIYVVNVLDDALYQDAHIHGSIQVSLTDLAQKAKAWRKNAIIVTYCSNYACTASSYAARMLKKMGFENVYAYEGGMAEWYQLHKQDPSYAVDGAAQEAYLHVVMEKPAEHPEDVTVISSQELHDMLQKEHIL